MRALSMRNARILVDDDEPQIQRFLKTTLEVNGYEVALASDRRAGLAPPIGWPPSGPLGSVLPELREAMLQLRRTHPGWGADTILAELCTAPRWTEHPLPSRARIAALVGHANLTLPRPRRSRPACICGERSLGVAVGFTRVRRPTDHAQVERVHQTMTLQAVLGQLWPDPVARWATLEVVVLNLVDVGTVVARSGRALGGLRCVPDDAECAHSCRALGGRAPLEVYPQAGQSGRFERPEWEVAMLDLNRVSSYLLLSLVSAGGPAWIGRPGRHLLL
jgi:hypothetical protein